MEKACMRQSGAFFPCRKGLHSYHSMESGKWEDESFSTVKQMLLFDEVFGLTPELA